MITNSIINYRRPAGEIGDASLGNMFFKIAGIIGIATHNGYEYGFPKWVNQQYFANSLPLCELNLRKERIVPDLLNVDFGFKGFDYPDGIDLNGEFGSWKYFEHCADLVKSYFTMLPQCIPMDNCVMVHYRNYQNPAWYPLGEGYYKKALQSLPDLPVCVVTDNIDAAWKATGIRKAHYTSNSPIVDFYLLSQSDYLVMGNSTFSWWAAYLSGAETIAPARWYDGVLKNANTNDLYLPNWTKV